MSLACVRFTFNTVFLWVYNDEVQMSTPERLGFLMNVPYYGRVVGKMSDRANMLLAEQLYGSQFVIKIKFGNVCLIYYHRQPGLVYDIVELTETPKKNVPIRKRKKSKSKLRIESTDQFKIVA